MAFTPTVDKIGDSALTDSIIDRSITELQDSVIATLQPYALAACPLLKKCVFVEVTEVLNDCFSGSDALETLEFYSAVDFDASALQGLPNLKTLILRSETMCDASSSAVLSYTPIDEGTGYIYVPKSLEDSYKHDFVWGSYASQIRAIEDYEWMFDPYSWESVAYNIEAGTYKSTYAIGDCVPLDLGSEGVINMQIAAFDTDDLADGSGKAAITWVAKELLATYHRMNPMMQNETLGTGSLGGWESCEMRSYLSNTIKPIIPTNAASLIEPVVKSQYAVKATVTQYHTQTTIDEIWIPTSKEVNGGVYAKLFADNAARKKGRPGQAAYPWWLRNGRDTNAAQFYYVQNSGSCLYTAAQNANGVCIGFCTGRAK